ncbi:MAG: hypothetical protein ACKV2T_21190 [Kofleriaceae bacterium]
MSTDSFMSIESSSLDKVSGGAARVTGRGGGASAELTTMLTQIGDSVKGLASKKDDGGGDMMPMMMMMMMMGGGQSAPAQVAAPPPPPQQPVINISTRVGRG